MAGLVGLALYVVLAWAAMVLPAAAARVDSSLPGTPVASRPAADADAVARVIERQMVADKLQSQGFSEPEVRLLLQAMNGEQFRQLANATTLSRNDNPRNLLIALLTAVFLIAVSFKLTDGLFEERRSTDPQRTARGATPGHAMRRRTDPVSSDKISGAARSRQCKLRRSNRGRWSGKAGSATKWDKRRQTGH